MTAGRPGAGGGGAAVGGGDALAAVASLLPPEARAALAPGAALDWEALLALGPEPLAEAIARIPEGAGEVFEAAVRALERAGEAGARALAALEGRLGDRERAKRVRRALHVLRSRGVAAPPRARPRRGVAPEALPEAQRVTTWLAPPDALGHELYLLHLPLPGAGGVLLEVLAHDERGLLRVRRTPLAGREGREALRRLRRRPPPPFAAASPERVAARLLARAGAGRAPGAELEPEERTRLERLAAAAPPEPEPAAAPAAEPAPTAAPASSPLAALDRLLVAAGAPPWVVEGEPLERARAVLETLETSPIVLPGTSEAVRRRDAWAEALARAFPPELRAALGARLARTAEWAEARGEREGGAALRRLAARLGSEGDPEALAFLSALLERSLAADRARREREEAPRLVVTPYEAMRARGTPGRGPAGGPLGGGTGGAPGRRSDRRPT